ncbi:uncharacterized protein TrAFT101_000127 [Trichoderma asperellum]|uniref:Uncharacterized protein n=1 Tax=Trichoderma asperellum (strain ATCC 204424 / CBS 433.97 / NBRC 101777) TaxID=1042311 RepID=A0A2T3YUA7_TRIA4|nr:hypothetical protein M441DRAFT_31301 [Trichoderma asperellum CBS 433.97]PTB36161.1 hypothetical protein M441DRAFT_31301 [Trichoderma asperellum CBS 433.97]UKZ84212.1 hypothetical protein TrAFT101_000127 [Trichoderma asperellum]
MFAKYSFFVLALATAALGGAVSNAEHASEAAACKPLNARCAQNKECCSEYCSWTRGFICYPSGLDVDPIEQALKAGVEAYIESHSG